MQWLIKLLGGGLLDRALDTVDKKIAAETDKEKIKADIIREHMTRRSDWLSAGGLWTLLIAGAPFIYHAWWVVLYSVHWCADCHNPKEWTVAALPQPFNEYQGWIMMAFIGALGLFTGARKLGR